MLISTRIQQRDRAYPRRCSSPQGCFRDKETIVHDLIVVTRNVADFADTGASVINPWETPA